MSFEINHALEARKNKTNKELEFLEWYQVIDYLDEKFGYGFVGIEKNFNYIKHYDNGNSPEETLETVYKKYSYTKPWSEILEGKGIEVETYSNVVYIHSNQF